MTSLPLAVMTAVAITIAVVESQSHPDFTGTWTMDRERSESMHQADEFEPPTLVITQGAADLTIETRRRLSTGRTVYTIGDAGTPAGAVPPAGPRAFWEGAALVTEAARTVQGQTVSVRESRTLDACQPQTVQRKRDDFGIRERSRCPNQLTSELGKLPRASRLRFFIAEDGSAEREPNR